MVTREDNRFSAIYTSIDDEYEEYVEITSGPNPYLVPSQRGPPPTSRYPPPSKPMPLPRGQQPLPRENQPTLPHSINQKIPPRNKRKPATPANKMAETPLELGTLQRGKHRAPDNLPLLESVPNIHGKLQPAFIEQETPVTPPRSASGQKYSALSADAEVNEYASLKPLAKLRTEKLRERAKKKSNKRLQIEIREENQREDSFNVNNYGTKEPVRTENLTDSSRIVCILLTMIVVCLLLAIGSLITAVYTITAFEKYKSNTMIKMKPVNECTIDIQDWITNSSDIVEQKCEFRADNNTNSQGSIGSDTNWQHPLSCSIQLDLLVSLDYLTYTATLIEDSTPQYCKCSLHKKNEAREPKIPIPPTTRPTSGTTQVTPTTEPTTEPITEPPVVMFTCLITETVLGVK